MAGLKIDALRDQRSSASVFVSTRRLYLNAADEVVEANSPDAVQLLVPEGGSLPIAAAEAYGLVTVTPLEVTEVTEVKQAGGFEDKQIEPKPAKRSRRR